MKVFFHHNAKLEHFDSDLRMKGRLLEDFSFSVFEDPKPDQQSRFLLFTVPKGFITDGASVPRILWGIPGFAPYGRNTRSAIAHDWLYSTESGYKIGWRPYATQWEQRLFADEVMYAGMKEDGENRLVRYLTFEGVRLGGASHWKRASE